MDDLTMFQMIPKFIEAATLFSRLHALFDEVDTLTTDDETRKYILSARSYMACSFSQVMSISLRYSMGKDQTLEDSVTAVDRSVSTYLAELNDNREKLGMKPIVPEEIGE